MESYHRQEMPKEPWKVDVIVEILGQERDIK